MAIPEKILQLVERFDQNSAAYKQGRYNETQTRREFIDPFFKALGWDIDNETGQSELNKDVIHEDAIKVEHATKAPDYCFRIGGARKFFVEAKKPSVDIKGDTHPAYQLRRYGWSAKLPLSILTDFEEFAVYDCRIMPEKTDKAVHARLWYLTYSEYLTQWETMVNAFSREAVLSGAFDQYAETHKDKRGTLEVDVAFLQEIERWREQLAQHLALRNPGLTRRELNYAVQRTIDRMIFLRICEDRGIEPYGKLQTLQEQTHIYGLLLKRFYDADARYNSGIFHFKNEREHQEQPDTLTPNLTIDDDVLKGILRKLYYPDSPYAFEVIPAEILGQVYEQFLGKVICLDTTHRATVEEKPEVKKAGGVYYTPAYIVEYIVKQTVGELLHGKTPKHAETLTILDPACGSGSFLIGAYQYLLDWYRAQYIADDPKKWSKGKRPRLYQIGNDWKLTIDERKRILLAHIYGVDIDSQAVEVTKLSLLLKVLEGENEQSISSQMALFHERVLPNLASNIKCGNSLIGNDFYSGKQISFDEEELIRINAFDWKNEFSEIIKSGGFGVVIGNPPYIQLSMADYYNKEVSSFLGKQYSSSMGRLNTFGLFIDKVLRSILTQKGYFSFIVPNTLLTQEYYQSLRKQILKHQIIGITSYKYPVFKDAVVETIVFVICNSDPNGHDVKIIDFDNKAMTFATHSISQQIFSSTHNTAFLVTSDENSFNFKQSLDKKGVPLGELANLNQAIALKYDRSKSLFTVAKADNYKPVIDGRNINRYELIWGGQYLAYDVANIHSCKRTDIFETNEKIFFRRVGDRLIATYDDQQFYALNTLVVITLQEQVDFSIKYLLGLINSSLLNFYYVKYLKSTKKVFSEIQARQLAQLPIRKINLSDHAEETKHNKIVSFVDQMLNLHKQLVEAKTPQVQTILQRQIEATDQQIDQLVYELYDLTAEEIAIIEAGTTK